MFKKIIIVVALITFATLVLMHTSKDENFKPEDYGFVKVPTHRNKFVRTNANGQTVILTKLANDRYLATYKGCTFSLLTNTIAGKEAALRRIK